MSALVALETARVEANRQQIYLTVIVPPQLPEEANFPKPLRLIGLTVLCALALWLIGAFLLFAIREHM
jgi:capsular polysaccharide transport system permease protein